MELKKNERLDYVNDDIELIQNTDGLTFGTDALLLAGYVSGKHKDAVELGGGTGIISMLLLARDKVKEIKCVEIQDEFTELIVRNAAHNGLADRLTAVCSDVRDFRPERECELVFTNPPYMKTTSGKSNLDDKKNISRHEVAGTIYDFCKSGAKMLKHGGTFAVVYRPDRLIDLIDALRESRLEPKRMTYVHANAKSEPSMVLIEAKKGGKCGLKLTRPLLIYKNTDNKDYSEEMSYIMENGSFPKEYRG